MTPDEHRVVAVPDPYDLRRTLGALRHVGDLATSFPLAGPVWRATRTPEGPATASYRHDPAAATVTVAAWGPGAAWAAEHAPALLGCDDDPSGLAALAGAHPLVADLHRRHAGLRVPRSLAVYEAALPVVCAQKVTGPEARRAWRGIQYRYGEPAPGPVPPGRRRPLRLPPPPERMAAVPYHALHPLGVERKRAETLRAVAREAARLDAAAHLPLPDAYRRLRSVPGVGAWTAAVVGAAALADADAVPVGDYHIPDHVCFALAGEPRGTDERMLELLAPFAPHRGRVCRLLVMGGPAPPRYGPRLPESGMRFR